MWNEPKKCLRQASMCAALYLPLSGGGEGAALEDAPGPAVLRRPMLRQRNMCMYAYLYIWEGPCRSCFVWFWMYSRHEWKGEGKYETHMSTEWGGISRSKRTTRKEKTRVEVKGQLEMSRGQPCHFDEPEIIQFVSGSIADPATSDLVGLCRRRVALYHLHSRLYDSTATTTKSAEATTTTIATSRSKLRLCYFSTWSRKSVTCANRTDRACGFGLKKTCNFRVSTLSSVDQQEKVERIICNSKHQTLHSFTIQ